jgi:hypothetical protein
MTGASSNAAGAHPRVSPRVAWQTAGEEAVIIDLDGRRVMGLNATGTLLWTHLDGSRSVDELAALVAREFAIPAEAARLDVDAFLQGMVRRGFVTV